MKYKMNVPFFQEALKKSTLNFCIDSTHLNIGQEKIQSRMMNVDKNVIILLDIKNEVIEDLETDTVFDFNFSDPQAQLMPFLNIIDNDEVTVDIFDEKIVIKDNDLSTKVFFCSPTIVSTFGSQNARSIDSFLEMELDNDFYAAFLKIKKIGSKFGKIYFTIKNGDFFIETLDKSNSFSNGISYKLKSGVDIEDLTMLFNFKNFVNLFLY